MFPSSTFLSLSLSLPPPIYQLCKPQAKGQQSVESNQTHLFYDRFTYKFGFVKLCNLQDYITSGVYK